MLMLFVIFIFIVHSQPVTVQSHSGTFRGRENPLRFLGIPFGTAERWQRPKALFNITVDATEFGNSCPQICRETIDFCPSRIAEDCLNLNIWTPFTRSIGGAKLPVLIFIHGGSFETGSGSLSSLNGMQLSKDLNAIVVTFNYRLSIFGFHGLDDLPPNPGFLDQQLALKWVYDNIADFGGDLSNLTLMGQSAGAASALLHLSNHQQKSWFANAIIMSAPILPFRTLSQAQAETKILMNRLNCDDLACLQKMPFQNILAAFQDQKSTNGNVISVETALIPVIDNLDIVENGFSDISAFNPDLNIIYGTTSNETSYSIQKLIPTDFDSRTSKILMKGIFGRSFNDSELNFLDYDQRDGLVRSLSDSMFTCPIQNYFKFKKASNVYVYYWETPWVGGLYDSQGKMAGDYACHTVDLLYLFNESYEPKSNSRGHLFRKFLRNFISTGDVGKADGVSWKSYSESEPNVGVFTRISDDNLFYNSPRHPNHQACAYWDSRGYFIPGYQAEYSFDGVSWYIYSPLILFVCLIWYIQTLMLFRNRFVSVQFKYHPKKITSPHRETELLQLIGASIGTQPKPISVVANRISYSVNGKDILQNCSAKFDEGSMTAIIGPSGSGKTTFMSIIAKQISDPRCGKTIFFNGMAQNEIDQSVFQNLVAFVAQYNLPHSGLTPREVLMFHAMLHLSSTFNLEQIVDRVDFLLRLIGLSQQAHIVIKEENRAGGLSGGQKRRLSIALALLQNPSVIFLDEPTSGLDSTSSSEIIELLKTLSNSGYTIIATIHQPRQEVFDLFTHVVVLVDGETAFCGSRIRAVQYFRNFSTQEFIYNTCDLIIDHVSSNRKQATRHKMIFPINRAAQSLTDFEFQSTSVLQQILILNSRYWTARPIFRKLSMSFIAISISLILGILSYRDKSDLISLSLTIKSILVSCLGLTALKNINFSFDYYNDRDFYEFDRLNGTISSLAFFIHRLILETATSTFEALLCGFTVYLLSDTPPLDTVGSTVLFLIFLYYNCITSFFAVLYSTRLDRPTARSISFLIQALFGITSGLYVQKGETFAYDLIAWVEVLNPNYWILFPLIGTILRGTGDCVVQINGSCNIFLGDVAVIEGNFDKISADSAAISLLLITATLRIGEFLLLYRDSRNKLIK